MPMVFQLRFTENTGRIITTKLINGVTEQELSDIRGFYESQTDRYDMITNLSDIRVYKKSTKELVAKIVIKACFS